MSDSAVRPHAAGKVWFLLTGALCLVAGFLAMVWPVLATVAITQFIGAFSLVSGIFLLLSAVFGKARQHRILDFLSALLRVAVGVLLLINVVKGMLALTLVLASIFIAEGILGIVFALRLKAKNPAWFWLLLNGVVAIVLGGMLLAKFPSDAEWAIGLLFGINCAFLGVSLVMFGLGLNRAEEA